MRVLRPGRPWSTDVECRQCMSVLRVTADAMEYHDVKRVASGVGTTCPVCEARVEIPGEVPPAVEELVRRRKGLAPKKPEVVKWGRPRNFKVICGYCEAQLLVEPEDIYLVEPDSFRTKCAACSSTVELPHEAIPEEIQNALKP